MSLEETVDKPNLLQKALGRRKLNPRTFAEASKIFSAKRTTATLLEKDEPVKVHAYSDHRTAKQFREHLETLKLPAGKVVYEGDNAFDDHPYQFTYLPDDAETYTLEAYLGLRSFNPRTFFYHGREPKAGSLFLRF
jgi:hypothetical protein